MISGLFFTPPELTFALESYSFKGTFWIYSLWICWRKTSISSQAKALNNHMAVDIISQSDILLQENGNITLSQWGWECADEPLSSPEGFPHLALMSFSPSNLFHSKIPWNSPLARKEEKIMSLCPHFLHTWWHWHDARGAGSVHTGNGSTPLPGSCCPEAGERLCRLLPSLRVSLPLWNDVEKPKQEPRTGSSAATLVSSPPEHLGLVGPLLPPSHGTTLSSVPWIATAAMLLSCVL